jgi:hypothetical protein
MAMEAAREGWRLRHPNRFAAATASETGVRRNDGIVH